MNICVTSKKGTYVHTIFNYWLVYLHVSSLLA